MKTPAELYTCLANRWVKVGSNYCDQFRRLSGCTGKELWGECGDVRPDYLPCPTRLPGQKRSRIPGLLCIRNPVDPNLVCPPSGFRRLLPDECPAASVTGGRGTGPGSATGGTAPDATCGSV